MTRRRAIGVVAGGIGLLTTGRSAHAAAQDAFLRGAAAFRRLTREDNAHARAWFLEAIRLDPMFARAYANLCATHRMDWQYEWVTDTAAAEVRALDLARQSVALNPDLPYGHQQLSFLYNYRRWYDAAIAEAQLAIVGGGPTYADGPACLALALTYAGQPTMALLYAQQAIRLDPQVAVYHYYLGQAFYVCGQYERYSHGPAAPAQDSFAARQSFAAAEAPLLQAMSLQQHHRPCRSYLCASLVELGRVEEARQLWQRFPDMPGLIEISARRPHAPHRDRWIGANYIQALRVAAGVGEAS
jgi:tetratricopeptide (TPR) repeat protein